MYPSKLISISGQSRPVHGLSVDDPYFATLSDNLDPEYNRLVDMMVVHDSVCLDIGANIGVKAIQLAIRAPHGRVIAIEAAPKVYNVLQTNATSNSLPNLTIEHAAVTDHEGSVFFKDESAYGHIAADGAQVPATTVAALVARHDLTRLDFIKIDVEGSEFTILRSSIDLFRRFESVVCFEFNTWCMLAFTNEHPRLCLEWVLANFAEVYMLRRGKPPEESLVRVGRPDAAHILAANMFHDGHYTDIVACTAPSKVRY